MSNFPERFRDRFARIATVVAYYANLDDTQVSNIFASLQRYEFLEDLKLINAAIADLDDFTRDPEDYDNRYGISMDNFDEEDSSLESDT